MGHSGFHECTKVKQGSGLSLGFVVVECLSPTMMET